MYSNLVEEKYYSHLMKSKMKSIFAGDLVARVVRRRNKIINDIV